MAWTTPGTATAGNVLTAAFWNTNVRDNTLALPRGYITHSTQTSNTNNIGTSATDTSLTVTFTAEANRRYKLSWQGTFKNENTIAQTLVQGWIADSANTVIGAYFNAYLGAVNAGDRAGGSAFVYVTPSAGSVTYKVRVQYGSGSVNVFEASATRPAILLVEDIGSTI